MRRKGQAARSPDLGRETCHLFRNRCRCGAMFRRRGAHVSRRASRHAESDRTGEGVRSGALASPPCSAVRHIASLEVSRGGRGQDPRSSCSSASVMVVTELSEVHLPPKRSTWESLPHLRQAPFVDHVVEARDDWFCHASMHHHAAPECYDEVELQPFTIMGQDGQS